eukprot:TRINITY_DN16139_c0_g1_i5.p1 TRINITY_DN16139_c0_g1~~TRINITY_DN16139_c0_g1_i5.p1  ORF type:complete len:175 (-),score=52.95 TRINITY_DN16139_c0_g1_i5:318-788(-)
MARAVALLLAAVAVSTARAQNSLASFQVQTQPATGTAGESLQDLDRPAADDDAAVNGMHARKTQLPMVYMNLQKVSEVASFLQKAPTSLQAQKQPDAAVATDVLRDLDHPASDGTTEVNGMYQRKTQMPMVYLNLHKASEAASFLQKQPAAAVASD